MKEYICIYDEDDMMYILNPYAQNTELIRCKDCKWHIKGGFCDLYFSDRAADEYCSRAERKEE